MEEEGGAGEECQQRSHVRWAVASSPGGPTQTGPRSPPSYLCRSKTNLAAHLRALLLAGRPGHSVGVRRLYGLIHHPGPCHQPLTTPFHLSPLSGGSRG